MRGVGKTGRARVHEGIRPKKVSEVRVLENLGEQWTFEGEGFLQGLGGDVCWVLGAFIAPPPHRPSVASTHTYSLNTGRHHRAGGFDPETAEAPEPHSDHILENANAAPEEGCVWCHER